MMSSPATTIGTDHEIRGVTVAIHGEQDYSGAVLTRSIVVEAGMGGGRDIDAAEARELAAHLLALADELSQGTMGVMSDHDEELGELTDRAEKLGFRVIIDHKWGYVLWRTDRPSSNPHTHSNWDLDELREMLDGIEWGRHRTAAP